MGQVFQYQAVPDDARTRGAEQSQLEGTAERTAQQWGQRSCTRGAELIVLPQETGCHNPEPGTGCPLEVRRWHGGWRWGNWLGCRFPGGWCQDFLCRPLEPTFELWGLNTAIWMRPACETRSAKPAGVTPKETQRKFCRVPGVAQSIYSANMKLELNLSAEIPWNLTSLMQPRVSVPPSKVSGKWKCEVPSSAASGQTWCLQIHSEILVLRLPWSIIAKEPLRF